MRSVGSDLPWRQQLEILAVGVYLEETALQWQEGHNWTECIPWKQEAGLNQQAACWRHRSAQVLHSGTPTGRQVGTQSEKGELGVEGSWWEGDTGTVTHGDRRMG